MRFKRVVSWSCCGFGGAACGFASSEGGAAADGQFFSADDNLLQLQCIEVLVMDGPPEASALGRTGKD